MVAEIFVTVIAMSIRVTMITIMLVVMAMEIAWMARAVHVKDMQVNICVYAFNLLLLPKPVHWKRWQP